MARVCESCGETYGDERAVCPNDGQTLLTWEVVTLRARAFPVAAVGGAPAANAGEAGSPAPPGLAPGRLLSERYLLVQQIGVGGFGVVFRARDRRLGKRVAVKVLSPQLAGSPRAAARFRQEALAASQVGHPGIVDVTDFDCDEDGTRFLVMEYLEGQDLASLIEHEGALEPARALTIAGAVAEAIGAAHAKGIVHRDLKPANIFLVPRPGLPDQVKVLDFGISKMLAEAGEPSGLTGAGQILGTPHYLSPEQAMGNPVIDGRTDIYSLGVILYELVCGATPFSSASYLGMITQHLVAVPERPSRRVPEARIPAALDALILRALEKDPARRFGSMTELAAAIGEVAAHLDVPGAPAGEPAITAPAPPTRETPGRAPSPSTRGLRRRLIAAAVAATMVLVGGLLIRGRRGPGGERPAPRRAVITAPPQGLTTLGGCSFYPAFLDAGTVAFEWSHGDDVSHLYRLPLAGGSAARLTSGTLSEFDIGPGRRPGEILYRVEDAAATARVGASHLQLRELASGAETPVDVSTTSAVAVGDDIYYARLDHGEIRRRRGQSDEVILAVTGDRTVSGFTASPDGKWLALASNAQGGSPLLCLLSLVGPARLDCPEGLRPIRGRTAFSPDSRVLYYPAADGIHRLDVQTRRDEVAVPRAFARAGVAVSPDASALVFSDCHPRGPLLDLTRSPPAVAVDDDLPREPSAGPGGLLAYVRERDGQHVLVIRDPQGISRDLTAPGQGSPSSPSFDPTGRFIAFEVAAASPSGIYVMDSAGHYPPEPVTTNPHDSDPIWTADGRIAFTRWDDQQNPAVMLIDRNGGTPQRAPLPSRKTVAYAVRSGELLLESKDKERLYLWKPGQPHERVVPLGPLAGSYFMASGISHDARFLIAQTGSHGRVVWRLWLDGSGRAPERLFAAGPGQTMSAVAITSDDRILVGARTSTGELHLVRAPAGTAF